MTYSIVKEIGTENTGKVIRESFLVKLDEPTVARGEKTFDLYEVDHLIVETLQINDDGVVYSETHVVASDEKATYHPAVLYLAKAALTVPEAMFAVAEHIYDPAIEEAGYDFSKLED